MDQVLSPCASSSRNRIPTENNQQARVPQMKEWGKLNLLKKQSSHDNAEISQMSAKASAKIANREEEEKKKNTYRRPSTPKLKDGLSLSKNNKPENRLLSLKLLPLNLMFQTWFRKLRKKRDFDNLENLKEHQLEFLGDCSFFPSESEKKSRKKDLYLSLQGSVYRLVPRFLNFKVILRFVPTIHPEGRLKLMWNIFFCLCILYQFFFITIELFFDNNWDKVNDLTKEVSFYTTETLKYLILLDVLMNMITGYFFRGGIIMDSRKIFQNYLRRLLLVDFIVIVPIFFNLDESSASFDHAGAFYSSRLSIIKLLFVFRLVKLKRTYYYIEQILSNNVKIEGFMALLKLFFKILFTAHLLACFWFFFGDMNRRLGDTSWMDTYFKATANLDWRTYYLQSLYWSITTMITVGYGDLTPTNNLEVGFVIVSMIIGCGVFGYSLSNIGAIFEKLFARENEIRSKLRIINRFMKRKNISFELQGKVRRYLDFVLREAEEENSLKEQELIGKLSMSLRKELLLQANGILLTASPILKNNFSLPAIQKLSESMVPMDLGPGDTVFEEGSLSCDQIYFISKGQIDLCIKCKNNRDGEPKLKTKSLRDGSMFGAFSFFTGMAREFTAISDGYTKLFVLNKEEFKKIMLENVEDYESFCAVRDSLIVYGNHSPTFTACFFCNDSDHNIHRCRQLKYVPDREVVVGRYLNRRDRRKHEFVRGRKKTSHAFVLMKKLLIVKENIEENYDFSLYDEELNKQRILNPVSLMQDKMKKSTFFQSDHNRSTFHNEENLGVSIIEGDPSEKVMLPQASLLPSGLPNRLNQSKKVTIVTEKESPRKAPRKYASSENFHSRDELYVDRGGAKEPVSLLDHKFDVGRNFKRYFPHNNMSSVIMKIRKKYQSDEEFNLGGRQDFMSKKIILRIKSNLRKLTMNSRLKGSRIEGCNV